ncbi:SusD/RagB family nutrient-binding outer membrane lipoprotein [Dysgonomonas sp. 520]|uniref:SusD/RagB family nutrient-binding outer membrane lipoprotein n=1 Tax=Dysgonomonas sp. 520 TaxID=2302931 RepID=UPI0013D221F1|nr:SusD/RagB family nutrient-binding outer membrane lipoprotein [Dysgonomonas sp. 520]NDW10100.1 SusD/RagB family nutrient-binding outer membrane lipoprotein [Dysgonomonas sp. 520]
MKIKNLIYYIVGSVALLTVSCDDYLDVNNNPNKPTTATLASLLPGAQYEIANSFATGDFLGTSLPSYVFHLSTREVDNFSISSTYVTMGNTWLRVYTYGVKNIDAVIEMAEETDNSQYAGIGKLLKAYLYTNLVDLWGDVPYSEANVYKLFFPKLDKDKEIYNDLFVLIDEAIADLENEESTNKFTPGKDDLFYGGDIDLWIKMGNTLKLKLLVNSRKAKSDITNWDSKLSSLLSENNFLEDGEDFEFKHTDKDNPDERNQAYVSEYLGGQSTYYISPWIYETMSGLTYNVKDNPFVNIKDIRVPYYWVNQCTADSIAQNMTDYRDGGFVSIFFASNSSYAGSDQRSSSSFIGIYPCGGKYDDGKGGKCDKGVGTGIAPEKLLQAYSVPFLKAELYLTGDASGDARAMLDEGIRSSIEHVNTVSQAAKGTAPVIEKKDINEFVEKILTVYDKATTNDEKLRIVMTQKWIANFFNPVEAYTDYRRTGYPTLISKETREAISPYKPDKEPTIGPETIPLKGINNYPRALWYPDSEVSRNPNVTNEGRDLSSKIIFWDK